MQTMEEELTEEQRARKSVYPLPGETDWEYCNRMWEERKMSIHPSEPYQVEEMDLIEDMRICSTQ